jgi:hypothetical protein
MAQGLSGPPLTHEEFVSLRSCAKGPMHRADSRISANVIFCGRLIAGAMPHDSADQGEREAGRTWCYSGIRPLGNEKRQVRGGRCHGS